MRFVYCCGVLCCVVVCGCWCVLVCVGVCWCVCVCVCVCGVCCALCVVCGVCCACCVCCVCCACWCVLCGAAWHAENTPVCRSQTPPCVRSGRLRVYWQHAHMCSTCVRFASIHGDVLNVHTEASLNPHTRWRGGSSPVLLTKRKPTKGFHLPQRGSHQRNPWILPIKSLRIGRTRHVPDSSNHSLYLMKLLSSNYHTLEGTSCDVVRFVHRPFLQAQRTICTSVSL